MMWNSRSLFGLREPVLVSDGSDEVLHSDVITLPVLLPVGSFNDPEK